MLKKIQENIDRELNKIRGTMHDANQKLSKEKDLEIELNRSVRNVEPDKSSKNTAESLNI